MDYDQNLNKYILCTVDKSWLIHESLGLKPDWLGVSKLVSSRNKKTLKMIFSKNVPQIGKRDTGR